MLASPFNLTEFFKTSMWTLPGADLIYHKSAYKEPVLPEQ